MASSDGAVKIAVRERPIPNLSDENIESVVAYHSPNILIVDERPFAFDYTIDPDVTQENVFQDLVKPLVEKTVQGFHSTVLAYGQTGTGKTYTMGLHSDIVDDRSAGIVPRALIEIFNLTQEHNTEDIYTTISISFIEIYNEKVYDLLVENNSEPINIKGHKFSGGMKKIIYNNDDGFNILKQGNKNRHVRPTKMNTQSSRSHAIFTIHVTTRTPTKQTNSLLHLVDLAGSEGVRRTGHQGVALIEGVHINQGLLSIGKVLQALGSGGKVIPYRDSVLSLVLQDSLNSNSYLMLVACISPQREDLSETLSTLRFAQNAKSLKNAPQINSILLELKKKVKTPSKIYSTPTPRKTILINKTLQSLSQKKNSYRNATFCSPNKMRKIESNRLNRTDIGYTPNDKFKNCTSSIKKSFTSTIRKISKNSIMSVKDPNKTFDSRESVMSFNVSTSTGIDVPVVQNSYSPIVRRCLVEFETTMENKMKNMFDKLKSINSNENGKEEIKENTNLTSLNNIKDELKTFLRDEILTLTSQRLNEREFNDDSAEKLDNIRCQLFSENNIENEDDNMFDEELELNQNSTKSSPLKSLENLIPTGYNDDIFKIPYLPINNSKKSVLVNNSLQDLTNSHIDQENITILPNLRRSLRLSRSNSINTEFPSRRNSTRYSLATKNTKNTRPSIRLENKVNRVEVENKAKPEKRMSKAPTDITVIANYFNSSKKKNSPRKKSIKVARTEHKKGVLHLLNTGNIKELQILPQIGLKMAYLIITHRTLNGKFKNFEQLSKLPIWRGKAWERFKQVNNID